uniref:Uncharacterized protein n=1 Tax=Panagrolaimus sp. JU765 TaxID=591449 RepID=A0AC34RTD0_9BILA
MTHNEDITRFSSSLEDSEAVKRSMLSTIEKLQNETEFIFADVESALTAAKAVRMVSFKKEDMCQPDPIAHDYDVSDSKILILLKMTHNEDLTRVSSSSEDSEAVKCSMLSTIEKLQNEAELIFADVESALTAAKAVRMVSFKKEDMCQPDPIAHDYDVSISKNYF